MAGEEIRKIHCCMIAADRLRIYMASSERGALSIGLLLDKGPDSLAYFKRLFPKDILIEDKRMNASLIEAAGDALSGRPVSDALKLDIRHTPFQMKVWEGIRKIPFGETMTYGEVAAMTGCPGGARAIGQAMARNPLPLIFPCHRVVAVGGLGGFGAGPELKEYLLKREKSRLLKNI